MKNENLNPDQNSKIFYDDSQWSNADWNSFESRFDEVCKLLDDNFSDHDDLEIIKVLIYNIMLPSDPWLFEPLTPEEYEKACQMDFTIKGKIDNGRNL